MLSILGVMALTRLTCLRCLPCCDNARMQSGMVLIFARGMPVTECSVVHVCNMFCEAS